MRWLYDLINRVQEGKKVDDEVILYAKHRVLHWGEAFIAQSEIVGSDDAKAMLCLLGWRVAPGLKVFYLDI